MTFSPKVWGDVLRRLQNELPEFAYDAWIAPLAVKSVQDRVLLGCPSSFHRDRVRNHYAETMQTCWQSARSESGAEERTPLRLELLTMKEFDAAEGAAIEVRLPERSAVAVRTSSRAPVGQVATGGATNGPASTIASSVPRRAHTPNTSSMQTATLRPVPDMSAPRATLMRSVPNSSNARSTRAAPDAPNGPAQPELPFSFESFVVGPCNALAREAALALARRRQPSLNQLYLAGGSGLGKTHLARATAIEARRHGQTASAPARPHTNMHPSTSDRTPRVVYTSAEEFTSDFVSAMRLGRSEEWKSRYRGAIRMLIVEDVQFFSGRAKTQLELFHTVQHVLDAGGCVLLTGDRAPRDLGGLDERMREQVGRGFVAELELPDALVRRHILRSKASAGGVHLPPDCLDLLVETTTGSVRDIESVLIQVVTTSSLLGRSIDLELTREAIDVKSGASTTLPPKSLSTSEIVRIVSAFFGKRPEALASRSRRRDVLVPRQLAMYLAHRYTDASFTEIGRELGRDHPSVRNAIQRIERLVLENAPLRYQVEALSERIDQETSKRR